jgi:hypothetical protein
MSHAQALARALNDADLKTAVRHLRDFDDADVTPPENSPLRAMIHQVEKDLRMDEAGALVVTRMVLHAAAAHRWAALE